MGSVKDLVVISPAFENRPGLGNFIFSDRYSVFDWGEMPDRIPNKGKALAMMAACNFEELERRGIRTHYEGMVAQGGQVFRFADLGRARGTESDGSAVMQVRLARVYRPVAREFLREGDRHEVSYDYSFFEANRGSVNNYLVGLEIIFRNGLPLGSSVFRKIAKAKEIADPGKREREMAAILGELGLEREPQPGQMLPRPVMSYTTKLEEGDRSLTLEEAERISGLTAGEFRKVPELALRVNECVTELAARAGFEHFDGKVEMIYDGGLLICDVLGTFDENRFGFRGEQISKEVLRQWYERHQPEFSKACEHWKKSGSGWQERCDVKPAKLPPELVDLAAAMYMAGCNRYTGQRVFDAPDLERVLEKLAAWR
jgi:phosphoribosylaminoimidazole-succinocarboxamide synthase